MQIMLYIKLDFMRFAERSGYINLQFNSSIRPYHRDPIVFNDFIHVSRYQHDGSLVPEVLPLGHFR